LSDGCKIERITQTELRKLLGEQGETVFTRYKQARDLVVDQVLPEIKAVQPALTDHGPKHVRDVLEKAHALLGKNCIGNGRRQLNAVEAYCLLLCVIFHDVGNIYGRDGHQHHVASVYDYVHSEASRDMQEKQIILTVAGAHCGEASDGSKDTLRQLGGDAWLLGQRVRMRDVSAILRLADELAEGPQRTSTFMRKLGYPPDAQVYHEYARATRTSVDQPSGRIALDYHIEVECDGGKQTAPQKKALKDFLCFIEQRALKVDQEMRYASFYSPLLREFRSTSITMGFWIDGNLADLDLQPVVLTDLVVPGTKGKLPSEIDSKYSYRSLASAIARYLSRRKGGAK